MDLIVCSRSMDVQKRRVCAIYRCALMTVSVLTACSGLVAAGCASSANNGDIPSGSGGSVPSAQIVTSSEPAHATARTTTVSASDASGCAEASITTNLTAEQYAAAVVDLAQQPSSPLLKGAVALTADSEMQVLRDIGTADVISQTPVGGQGDFARRVCASFRKLHPELSSGVPSPFLLFLGYEICREARIHPGPDAFKVGAAQAGAADIYAGAHDRLCPQL